MAVNSIITGSKDGEQAKVVIGNALAVSPPFPSESFNATLETDDTAVNIVPAKADHIFYVTGIFLTGNRDISTTVDATVTIYTADAADTAKASAIKNLVIIPVARSTSVQLNPILIDAPEGKYINGETSDDNVLVTILGYYVEVR